MNEIPDIFFSPLFPSPSFTVINCRVGFDQSKGKTEQNVYKTWTRMDKSLRHMMLLKTF